MQEKKNKIDLYLISGFLGAGKTTFLQNVLDGEMGQHVGLIVNEFGSVNIDGISLKKKDAKLVEINNGSIFCACLKGGFVKTLAAFLQQPINRLFVEASGMADPSSMNQLLESMNFLLSKKEEINAEYVYKGSICVVDAMNFEELSESILPVANQVRKSGLILLNKTDLISEEKRSFLHEKLRQLNEDAYIYDTSYAKVPREIMEQFIRTEKSDMPQTVNSWSTRPFCGNLKLPEEYEEEQMRRFLELASQKMIRIKGYYKSKRENYLHVECVGDHIEIKKTEEEIKTRQLVLISVCEETLETWLEEQWKSCFDEEMILETE